MIINNMISNIGRNLARLETYQRKMATGKKISVPSDDPVVAARALKLRTDVSMINQYKTNVEDAMSWLEITESSLANVGEILQRARELAVQGSSDTATAEDTKKIADEIEQLKVQLIQIANATYAGRYIFSGFKTDTKLLDDDGNFLIDVSNSESIMYEIGISDKINVNVVGCQLFNDGTDATAGDPAKLIQNMNDFINALVIGDKNLISDCLTKFDKDINNLLAIRSSVGARYNRLELTKDRLENDLLNFTALMSENEDVDQAENIMLLKNEENVYKASLSAGASIMQTSLIDFLR